MLSPYHLRAEDPHGTAGRLSCESLQKDALLWKEYKIEKGKKEQKSKIFLKGIYKKSRNGIYYL
jgi:hypothetical protein